MIRRLIAYFRKPEPQPVVDMADIIIARRALRSRNRDANAATLFEGVHNELKLKLGKPYLPTPEQRKC